MISGLKGLGSEGWGLGKSEPSVKRGGGVGGTIVVVVGEEEWSSDGGGSRVKRPYVVEVRETMW